MRYRRYQNSWCKKVGFLHAFKPIMETGKGVLERCGRCKEKKHFPHGMNNARYLSYHIRDILRANDPMFRKEFPNITI